MKGVISEKLRRQLWKIVKKEMGAFYYDKAHGYDHLCGVHKHFISLIKNKPKVDKDILKSLECAVILHDIGRASNDDAKHGEKSAEVVKRILRNEKYLKLPHEEWVLYAVKWHPKGKKAFKNQKTEPKKNKEKWLCLAFLVLLDHMDTMGKRGIKRAKEYLGEVPEIPQGGRYAKLKEIKKLEEWFNSPQEIDSARKNLSLLEHLCSNYYWIQPNLRRIEGRLPREFIDKYKKLGLYTKKHILKLVKK